jgi:hypothetical protein
MGRLRRSSLATEAHLRTSFVTYVDVLTFLDDKLTYYILPKIYTGYTFQDHMPLFCKPHPIILPYINHFTFLWFFFGCIRNDNATGSLSFSMRKFYQHPIIQWFDIEFARNLNKLIMVNMF